MNEHALLAAALVPSEGSGGFFVAEWADRVTWIPTTDIRWLTWIMGTHLAKRHDLRLGTVPYRDQGSRLMQSAGSILWARVESGHAAERLAQFKPAPTIVLRDGGTVARTAIWALTTPILPDDIERANRRISNWLGAGKKGAAPTADSCKPSFTFSPPGTILRAGRSNPIVVTVEYRTDHLEPFFGLYPPAMTSDQWRRRHNVPLLRDRPEPDRERYSRKPAGVA